MLQNTVLYKLRPQVFQRRMHELIEGLTGTEVVADDFVVAGFGETYEDRCKLGGPKRQGILQLVLLFP